MTSMTHDATSHSAEHNENAHHEEPAHSAEPAHAAPATEHGTSHTVGHRMVEDLKHETHSLFEKGAHGAFNLASSEMPEVREVAWYATPIEMIKHGIHGSVVNALRRTGEILAPTRDSLEGAWNTGTKLLASPIHSIFHPINYLANPTRFFTAGFRGLKNLAIKSPVSLVDEGYQGLIEHPIETVNFKTTKIPLIGPIISKTTNGVAKVLGWPLKGVDKVVQMTTGWMDKLDDYVGELQAA